MSRVSQAGDQRSVASTGPRGDRRGSGSSLTVARGVVIEMARLAASEVPGVARVGRRGPGWRSWLIGPDVSIRSRAGRLQVRVHVVAQPALPLPAVAAAVRSAIQATIERLLGLELASITVVIDAVGG